MYKNIWLPQQYSAPPPLPVRDLSSYKDDPLPPSLEYDVICQFLLKEFDLIPFKNQNTISTKNQFLLRFTYPYCEVDM